MEKRYIRELEFKISEIHVQYRDATGIIMHPETAKWIFSLVTYSTSYYEMSSLKYRGITIYRSLDIDENEFKVF